MASPCNSLNVQTIKISQLGGISGRSATSNKILPNDIFLLIQNGTTDAPVTTSLYSRHATFSDITAFIATVTNGTYSGNFTGTATGNFTGSFTGSLKGYISASNAFANKVAFHGTSSWAAEVVHALVADVADNGVTTIGGGATDNFAIWNSGTDLGYTPFLQRNSAINNLGTFSSGRLSATRPLQFSNNSGEQLMFRSSSGESVYGMSTQTRTIFTRTNCNSAIYYSGSYNVGGNSGTGALLTAGKNGWGVFATAGRLAGVGHFVDSNDIDAQCHVHLSGSTGWKTTYNHQKNVFLVTSGSAFTKLMRLSGSGQLDIAGDIVVASTFVSSDERLKKDIVPMEDGYEMLERLNPVSFNWVNGDRPDFGLIAQEVEKIYPYLVRNDISEYKVLSYTSFIPLLIKAVQEQRRQIIDLTDRVVALEAK